MRQYLIGTTLGVWLKKDAGYLELLNETDYNKLKDLVKGLNWESNWLTPVDIPLCTLANGDEVIVLASSSEHIIEYSLNKTLALGMPVESSKLTHTAWHAVSCFTVLAQLTQISRSFNSVTHAMEQRYTDKLIGVVSGILRRGQ